MIDSENRPWGRWEEYLNEPGYRVKRLIINPKQRFSLQLHKHRSEYWVIVAGKGQLTVNKDIRAIEKGETVMIPKGSVHRLENTGADFLVIIETQIGLCIENDIERLEDDYDRK